MRASRPGRTTWLLVAVGLLLFAGLMLLQPLPQGVGEPVAWGAQSLTVTFAVVAMLRRARHADGRLRQARILIALALVAGALAGVLAVVWTSLSGDLPPAPSIIDVVHLGFVPLVVAGLLRYPVMDTKAGSPARSLLDGAVAAGALWFVAYTLILGPASVGAGLPLPVQLTTLAYPAGDVFLLGMLAGVLPRVAARARRELVLTGAGLVLFTVGDLAYCVLEAAGTYRADSWVALLYEGGLVLIVLGVFSPEGTSPLVGRWSALLSTLPNLPVVAAIVVASGIAARGGGIDGGQLLAGIAIVAALFLRQQVSSRDRDVLTERLQAREELFRSLVTGASDLISLHDADGRVTYVSPAVERVLGVGQEQLTGRLLGEVIEVDDRERLREAFAKVVAEPGSRTETMIRIRAAAGEWRWMQLVLKNQLDDPSVRGVVGNARDVHERHLLERELAHAAFHDTLTGLGNLARARDLIDAAYDLPRAATVVLVDLDGFKAVNDTFGHAHGDALLCQVAARLTECVRLGDDVSRIGGDEFVLVLDGVQDAGSISARVLSALREPMIVAGTSLTVSASLGVAVTVDAASPDELLRNADLAMYASKAAGRNRVTWYEPWMHSAVSRRLSLDHGLRRALANDELSLHYQPIVGLPGGAVVGAEALVRWEHPVEGALSPEVFIPVAEETGFIGEIDRWVLERACSDVAAWQAAGVPVPPVSINVSRRQMTPELPDLLADALARHGLRGDQLCIEITESAVVADADVAARTLARVRELGVAVALDDFGSGQSSLSQLARLPVDVVKIDRSFTTTALSEPAALRLLTSIVGVCQALDLRVVAEGIEQGELADFLAGIGCDLGQGFHFGRPLPEAAFRAWLECPAVPVPRVAAEGSTLEVPR